MFRIQRSLSLTIATAALAAVVVGCQSTPDKSTENSRHSEETAQTTTYGSGAGDHASSLDTPLNSTAGAVTPDNMNEVYGSSEDPVYGSDSTDGNGDTLSGTTSSSDDMMSKSKKKKKAKKSTAPSSSDSTTTSPSAPGQPADIGPGDGM